MDSGAPYNLTVGQDLFGANTYNDRPALVSTNACAASTTLSANVVCTPLGTFNDAPGVGQQLPINYCAGPTLFTANFRLEQNLWLRGNRSAAARRPLPEGHRAEVAAVTTAAREAAASVGVGLAAPATGRALSEAAPPPTAATTLSVFARNAFNFVSRSPGGERQFPVSRQL